MPDTKPATTETPQATKDQSSNKETTRDNDKREKHTAADVQKLNENPKFDLPVSRVRTAEDAYQAYLREEISEEELRGVVNANGGSTFYSLKANLERPDNAFKQTVPEDLYDDPSLAVTDVEERLKEVEERDKKAEEAKKAADDVAEKFSAAEKSLDATTQAQLKNEASQKQAEKAEKQEASKS